MNLCDVNVWIALALSEHVHQRVAREWFDSIAEPATALFCRATQQAFLRLLTNVAVLAPYGNPPLTNDEAWTAYQSLLSDDRVAFQALEPRDLESRWESFALRNEPSPKLWMDAYLAAYAVGSGCRMVTTDAAYRQFDGLDLLVLC
ncbi:MAG: TA system VapC family ribonuclease toxin [Acidimicrobiales bacterium]